jgi:glutathione synthase/RimK-type ligase-like ATP-grasp enzyme
VQTPWAQHSCINFERIAQERGCIVLNDPSGLVKALDKLYLQSFPESVQPLTLVTRNREIKAFSPCGLGNVGRLEKLDFTQPAVEALESKVESKRLQRRTLGAQEVS